MPEPVESTIYEFGDFRLETGSRRLFRAETGEIVTLQPKAFELLSFLIESGGRILTKNEILETVWAESFVEEGNLSQTVFVLRKALNDDSKNPRFIVTLPNRGYRFIAKVKKIAEPAEAFEAEEKSENSAGPKTPPDRKPKTEIPKPAAGKYFLIAIPLILLVAAGAIWSWREQRTAGMREIKTLAVLPFSNIGGKEDEEYLGLGLSEGLANKLSNIKTIIVRPTTSVIKYSVASPDPKKIGSELGVEAVIIGRVQRIEDNIRVTVQMIRVSDSAMLWAETFDDKFTNTFAVQDSLSQKAADSLARTFTSGERQQLDKKSTTDNEAFLLYIQGRYFWNKRTTESLKKSADFFGRAIARDPEFARAYAGLADSYMLLGSSEYLGMNPAEAIAKAKTAANRAIALDDTLAEAHASLGFLLYVYDFDWPNAEKEFKRAIDLNPNYPTAHHWYGLYLIVMRRFDESEVQLKKALELDFSSLIINTDYGTVFYFSRRYDQAVAQYRKTLELEPRYAVTHWQLARVYAQQKRFDEAIGELDRAIELAGRSPVFLSLLGYLYGLSGRTAEAGAILTELTAKSRTETVSPNSFMLVQIGLGDRRKALEYLEQNFAMRNPSLVVLGNEPAFDPLRGEPRFQEILKALKLNSK
jgi:TolB-like protein/DNA-binding winged helix-turn-helix (wHTH) protein/Flp pilus assembly protein TadD